MFIKKKLCICILVTKFFNNIEINPKELFLINNYSEIEEALKKCYIEKISCLKFLCPNRTIIKKILSEEEKIIKINKDDITNNYVQCFFYLFYIINDDIYNINYSYDFDLINELYNRMTKEKKCIRKFILYIFAYPIVYNYEGIDESNSSDELEKIYNEIDEFMKKQQPLLEKYNLNLDLNNYRSFNIDDIYCQFILSLIRNEKLKNFNEAKDIMEQLDLENIELTHDMYINLKKEFDDNGNKNYINQYKIIYSENLNKFINEDLINFYFTLLKYVFKNEIYIYNIDFFLENRDSLLKIIKNNYGKLFLYIDNINDDEYKEKIKYVLKKFLDSSYNYIINKCIIESKKIKRRNEVINLIFKKIKEQLENFSKSEFDEIWKEVEKSIHDKNINNIRLKNEIFIIFNDTKNREDLLDIFNDDEIDFFINEYNKINKNDLTELNNYYNSNQYCESKQNDLPSIYDNIKNNKELTEQSKNMDDSDLEEKWKTKYQLIKYIFNYDEKNGKDEAKLNSYIKELNEIEKKLREKKELDEEIQIKLFKFFDINKKENEFNDIFSKEAFNYFIERKKEAINEILNYYKDFFPESKNNENVNFDDYSIAKKINKRKPLIFLFMDNKKDNKESEIQRAMKKWEQIETNIISNKFKNIEEEDKLKLIIFNTNAKLIKLIKEIFNNEQSEAFIKILSETHNKKNIIKNKMQVTNKCNKILMSVEYGELIFELIRKNDN